MFRIRRSPMTAALAAGAIMATSACTIGGDASDATTLTLGHTWAATDANAEAVQEFADTVYSESEGELRIEVYTGGQLGDDAQVLESLGIEVTDMWVGGSGVYNQMTAVGQFLVLPYLFEDIDEAMSHYDGDLGRDVEDQINKDTPTQLLSLWPRGARHLTMNEEVTSPDDLAGQRIRVPENPMILRSWEMFGASPTPMPFGDVLTALEQGVLEGQENPLETIDSAGLASAQSTLMLTSHVIEPTAVSISDAAWDKLTEEQQSIMNEAANGAVRDDLLEYVQTQEDRLPEELSAQGMNVIEPENSPFEELVADLVPQADPVVRDLYDRRWNDE